MKESAENLRLYGVQCSVQISGCERLMTQTASIAYELFEAVVEIGINTVSSILFRMETEGSRLFLTICADCTEDLTVLIASFPETVASVDEDGLWYLSREFEQGGACQ